MARGGKREGAGKPRGSKNKATLEKQKVAEAFNQRVMVKADALFNAQLLLALGSMKVFRIDETEGEKGKTKREHVHVTDPHEIKALLDEHDGLSGTVDGVYYYFADVLPDNKAIEGMLNRSLGKPTEKHEHGGSDGGPITVKVVYETKKSYA
ncbi:MAG: hypothetical protein AABN95_16025 [Acidobacteriota bacterium]